MRQFLILKTNLNEVEDISRGPPLEERNTTTDITLNAYSSFDEACPLKCRSFGAGFSGVSLSPSGIFAFSAPLSPSEIFFISDSIIQTNNKIIKAPYNAVQIKTTPSPGDIQFPANIINDSEKIEYCKDIIRGNISLGDGENYVGFSWHPFYGGMEVVNYLQVME